MYVTGSFIYIVITWSTFITAQEGPQPVRDYDGEGLRPK
jgi:hypothetical protein